MRHQPKTVTKDTNLYIRPIIPTCCRMGGNGVSWKILFLLAEVKLRQWTIRSIGTTESICG